MAPAADGDGTHASEERTDSPGAREAPSVLVADGPRRAERFESWLEPAFDVETCSRKTAAEEQVTGSVDVSILGAGVPPDTKEAILEVIDLRAPFARIVVVPHDDQPPMLEGPGFDACLYAPIEREHLLEVTRRMARIAVYERTVAHYFEFTTQAASMQVARKEGSVDERTFERLQEHIDRLQRRLRRMRDSLDDADREVLLESLDADPTAEFGGDVQKSSNRRQPDECAQCGLDWQTEHGGDLGTGCEKLGAFVWKCRRCGTVQQPGSPSHQWIA